MTIACDQYQIRTADKRGASEVNVKRARLARQDLFEAAPDASGGGCLLVQNQQDPFALLHRQEKGGLLGIWIDVLAAQDCVRGFGETGKVLDSAGALWGNRAQGGREEPLPARAGCCLCNSRWGEPLQGAAQGMAYRMRTPTKRRPHSVLVPLHALRLPV